MSKSFQIISVSGIGYTGSSALIDYFKSHEGVSTISSEFFLFRSPNGLLDLYNTLFCISLSHEERHFGITRFHETINKLNKFRYTREHEVRFLNFKFHLPYYKSVLGKNFNRNLNIFCNSLIIGQSDVGIIHSFLYMNIIFFKIIRTYNRVIGVLFRLRMIKYRKNYKNFIPIYTNNKEVFHESVSKFISSIYQDIDLELKKVLILNQAINPLNISYYNSYKNENLKTIIVIREPRDVYVELIRNDVRWMIGGNSEVRLERFIQYQQDILTKLELISNDDNILIIRFEDLCLKTEETLIKVNEFIQIEKIHLTPSNSFDPKVSMKNIGIYKSYLSQVESDFIYNNINKVYNYYL